MGVEVRSIRMESKIIYETTWPDLGEVLLNDKKLMDLKPLQTNSSLKKRKDERIFIEGYLIKEGHNKIAIKESNPTHD